MRLFFCFVGLVLIVEGLPYFAFPDRMKQWINLIRETPDHKLRVIGFTLMCLGLVIAFLAR